MVNPLKLLSLVYYRQAPTKQKRSSAGANCLVYIILGGSVYVRGMYSITEPPLKVPSQKNQQILKWIACGNRIASCSFQKGCFTLGAIAKGYQKVTNTL